MKTEDKPGNHREQIRTTRAAQGPGNRHRSTGDIRHTESTKKVFEQLTLAVPLAAIMAVEKYRFPNVT